MTNYLIVVMVGTVVVMAVWGMSRWLVGHVLLRGIVGLVVFGLILGLVGSRFGGGGGGETRPPDAPVNSCTGRGVPLSYAKKTEGPAGDEHVLGSMPTGEAFGPGYALVVQEVDCPAVTTGISVLEGDPACAGLLVPRAPMTHSLLTRGSGRLQGDAVGAGSSLRVMRWRDDIEGGAVGSARDLANRCESLRVSGGQFASIGGGTLAFDMKPRGGGTIGDDSVTWSATVTDEATGGQFRWYANLSSRAGVITRTEIVADTDPVGVIDQLYASLVAEQLLDARLSCGGALDAAPVEAVGERDCEARARMRHRAEQLRLTVGCGKPSKDVAATADRLDAMAATTSVPASKKRGLPDDDVLKWWDYNARVVPPDWTTDGSGCTKPKLQAETLAVVFGDLSKAEHFAISVPGMGSDVPEAFPREANRVQVSAWANNARRLYVQMQAYTDDPVATMAWLQFDPPNGADASLAGVAKAASDVLFRDVADFNEARDANRLPMHNFTLVGHSYGSLVVGFSQLRVNIDDDGYMGMADAVVFAGSPGVGVFSVRTNGIDEAIPALSAGMAINAKYLLKATGCATFDGIDPGVACFPRPGRVFTVQASNDPVTLPPLGSLGTPPHWREFGGHTMQVPNYYEGSTVGSATNGALEYKKSFVNHSHYFDIDPASPRMLKSVRAIASVTVGRYSKGAWVKGYYSMPKDL